MKPVLKMEYKRLLAYEDKMFDLFDQKTIISLPDRKLINYPKRDEIHIIPNGVDHDFFKPMDKPGAYDVVFTGNINLISDNDLSEKIATAGYNFVHKQYSWDESSIKLEGVMNGDESAH